MTNGNRTTGWFTLIRAGADRLLWVGAGSLVLVLVLAASCLTPGAAAKAAPTPTPTLEAGMPNPASVNCEAKGGKLEIVKGPEGETGMCIFPDGSRCEEWAFMRGECGPGPAPTPAATASPAPEAGMPNPASVNCTAKGGKLEIVKGPEGETGMCIFPDGSRCEEWAFMRGECQPAPPCQMPVINDFSSNPQTVNAGQKAVLSWGQVVNATAVIIDNSIGGVGTPGSREVAPTSTTTYWMVATSSCGTASKSLVVTVNPAPCSGRPSISGFSASPQTISPGGSATLSWGAVSNATVVSIDQGIGGVPTPGNRVVQPGSTTTYVMTAVGCGGTVQASVTVNVSGPIVVPPVNQTTPSNGADLNVNPRVATMAWNPVNVAGDVTYFLEVERNQHGMWVPYSSPGGLSSLAWTTAPFPEDSLARWRVWAKSNSTGLEGPKSDWWTFSLTPRAHEYTGNWATVDGNGPSRMEISAAGESLNIRLWVRCLPNECDAGSTTVSFQSEPVQAEFRRDGKVAHRLHISQAGSGQLRVVDNGLDSPGTYVFQRR